MSRFARQCIFALLFAVVMPLLCQTPALTTGEITVQLTQGLSSAANPNGKSMGRVTKSTNPAIPVGSSALVGLHSDPMNGGYTVMLMELGIHGTSVRAGSSAVALAPDVFARANELTRKPGAPKDSASGTNVFLPEKMSVRFTLAEPSATVTGSSASSGPDPRARTAPQPVLPTTWSVRPYAKNAQVGKQAVFYGTVEAKGKQERVAISLRCAEAAGENGARAYITTDLAVTIRSSLIPFDTQEFGEKDSFIDAGTSQLGSAPELSVNLYGGDHDANRTMISLGYEADDLKPIVDSPGVALKLTLGPNVDPTVPQKVPVPTDQTVHIAVLLPADNAPLKDVMEPCFAKQDVYAAEDKAAMLVSCPVLPGRTLQNIQAFSLLASGKRGKEAESDEGPVYYLPKATRVKPRPRMSLVCSYRKSGPLSGPSVSIEERSLAIPATANTCSLSSSSNELRIYGGCRK